MGEGTLSGLRRAEAVGCGVALRQPQSRGSAWIWKGFGQHVRLSVKAKVSVVAAGTWKVNFCRRAVKKMKSSVLASCSPGQARLPGKGAKITLPSPERASTASRAPLAHAALHKLWELFFLERLGGNVHPHILQKPSPEVCC